MRNHDLNQAYRLPIRKYKDLYFLAHSDGIYLFACPNSCFVCIRLIPSVCLVLEVYLQSALRKSTGCTRVVTLLPRATARQR